MKKLLFVLLGAFISLATKAQKIKTQEEIIAFINSLEPTEEDDALRQELLLRIEFLLKNPISLNYATEESLAEIPGIRPFEIQAILMHRKKFGSFLHTAELAAVQGISRQRAAFLSSFFDAGLQKMPFFQLQPLPKQALKLRIQSKINSSYLMDSRKVQPWQQALRLDWKPASNWNIVFQAEQDAGEVWRGKPDFISGSMARAGKGIVKTVLLGDFQASFSQGLWLGPGFQNQAGLSMLQQMRFSDGFKPYRSLDESRYLRGLAMDLAWKNWSFQLLSSFKKNNLNSISFDSISGVLVANLDKSGFNASESSQFQSERLLGIRLQRKYHSWNLAIAASWLAYSPRIQPAIKFPYQWGSRSFDDYKAISFQLRKPLPNGLFAAELLADKFGDMPVNLQWMQSLSTDLDALLAFRYFPQRYENPYSKAFSRWNQQDEKGLFANLIWQISKNQQLRTYFDLFDGDWIRYRKPFLVSGSEQGMEWRFQNRSGELVALKVTNKKESNQLENQLGLQSQRQLVVAVTIPFGDSIKLQSRYQHAFLSGSSNGQSWLFWSQLRLKAKPFQLSIRLSSWNSASSSLPLYSSDLNLPGMFSMASFYGRGHEFSSQIECKLKTMKVGLRWAQRPQSLNSSPNWSFSAQLNFELDGN